MTTARSQGSQQRDEKTPTGRPHRLLRGRVSFWLLSSAIFGVNALISLRSAAWMLATLQIMTAVLAILAAAEATYHHPPVDDATAARSGDRPEPAGGTGTERD